MKRIILGTAGHIDHGKTTFIKALTGIDCDRLKEEKERGITIELGYANLTLPSGVKVGIVDVPGHERFVSKMVAGASGIDIVAFIIAGDEGIKPQTREHLYICELLGVKRGIIVVTKKDLIDEELLSLQIEDIKDFIKGSFLEGAKIIPVSSITGEGLKDFIAELDNISKDVAEKPIDRPFRLPIDDVVTIKGFGTVVRGTVISGTISLKDDVAILPLQIKSRIRSIQSHGQNISAGYAGERIAINLPEVEKAEIERGMLVAKEGFFDTTDKLAVLLYYLPYNQKPLKSRFVSQFHIYTRRVEGEFFLINRDKLNPGEKAFALLRLKKPVNASYGDPFIVRGFGVYTTLGGGKIINPHLEKISKDITEDYLKEFLNGDVKKLIELFIKEKGESGITRKKLIGLLNISEKEADRYILDLKNSKTIFEDEKGKYYHTEVIKSVKKNILESILDFHNKNPLKLGINKRELFEKSSIKEDLFSLILNMLAVEKSIEIQEDIVKSSTFSLKDNKSEELFTKLEKLYLDYGLQPEDNFAEIAKKINEKESAVRDAISTLTKRGLLLKVKDSFYIHPKILEEMKRKILDHFSKKDLLTPQDMKELFNLSRKYTIPLLEYLDLVKFTIRVQEGRKLRGR